MKFLEFLLLIAFCAIVKIDANEVDDVVDAFFAESRLNFDHRQKFTHSLQVDKWSTMVNMNKRLFVDIKVDAENFNHGDGRFNLSRASTFSVSRQGQKTRFRAIVSAKNLRPISGLKFTASYHGSPNNYWFNLDANVTRVNFPLTFTEVDGKMVPEVEVTNAILDGRSDIVITNGYKILRPIVQENAEKLIAQLYAVEIEKALKRNVDSPFLVDLKAIFEVAISK